MIKLNKKQLIIGSGIAAIVTIAAIVYEVVIPNQLGDRYLASTAKNATALQATLKEVADSTTRPIFTSTPTTASSDKADIAIIQTKVADANKAIAEFAKTSTSLQNLPLSGYFGSYVKAKAVQADAKAVTIDIKSRMKAYEELLAYLTEQNKIALKYDKVTESLSSVEASVDLDKAIATFRNAAKDVRTGVKEFAKLQAPAELKQIQADNIEISSQMADAFDAFADATENLDIDGITAAARQMDAVSKRGTDLNKRIEAIFAQDSTLIKPVVVLPQLVVQFEQ